MKAPSVTCARCSFRGFAIALVLILTAGCQGSSSSSGNEAVGTGDSDSNVSTGDNTPTSSDSSDDAPGDPGVSGSPPTDGDDASAPPSDSDTGTDTDTDTDTDTEDPVATTQEHIYDSLEGYGTNSTFGIGGDICTVTNLNDAGSGSLRACIEGRRSSDIPVEVQFEVAGTITLESHLRIRTPFITINGSTAPSPGITIQTGPLKSVGIIAQTNLNEAHDVLLSHLRIVGAWDRSDQTDVEHNNTIAVDCENNDTGGDSVDLNIVLNRLTLMNSPDGGPDLWGACRGITVQRSFMHHNVHPMTVSAGSASQLRARISVHRNVFWNNDERNPQIRGNVQDLNYINNVVGGWRWYGVRVRANSATDHPRRINLLSNAWLANSSGNSAALVFLDLTDSGVVYTDDNQFPVGETDRGAAANQFGDDLRVARFSASQLSEAVIGEAGNYLVGTHYPTAEETDLLADIAGRL